MPIAPARAGRRRPAARQQDDDGRGAARRARVAVTALRAAPAATSAGARPPARLARARRRAPRGALSASKSASMHRSEHTAARSLRCHAELAQPFAQRARGDRMPRRLRPGQRWTSETTGANDAVLGDPSAHVAASKTRSSGSPEAAHRGTSSHVTGADKSGARARAASRRLTVVLCSSFGSSRRAPCPSRSAFVWRATTSPGSSPASSSATVRGTPRLCVRDRVVVDRHVDLQALRARGLAKPPAEPREHALQQQGNAAALDHRGGGAGVESKAIVVGRSMAPARASDVCSSRSARLASIRAWPDPRRITNSIFFEPSWTASVWTQSGRCEGAFFS